MMAARDQPNTRLPEPTKAPEHVDWEEQLRNLRLRARNQRAVEAGPPVAKQGRAPAAGPVRQSPQLGEGGSTGLDRSLPPSDREG